MVKCTNCKANHSAAFRGCPVFIRNKQILGIKSLNRITFAEAAEKYKVLNEQGTTMGTVVKEAQGTLAGASVDLPHQELGITDLPGSGKGLCLSTLGNLPTINHPPGPEIIQMNFGNQPLTTGLISQPTSTPIQPLTSSSTSFNHHPNNKAHCNLFTNEVGSKKSQYNLKLAYCLIFLR